MITLPQICRWFEIEIFFLQQHENWKYIDPVGVGSFHLAHQFFFSDRLESFDKRNNFQNLLFTNIGRLCNS